MPSRDYPCNKVHPLGNEANVAESGPSHPHYCRCCKQPTDKQDGCESKTTWWRLSHLNHLFPVGREINTISEIYYSEEKKDPLESRTVF